MGNARPAERIVVVAALVLSIAAIVFQPFMESASCAGLMRWISVGGISVKPWVLLLVSSCCTGLYLFSILKERGQFRRVVVTVSIIAGGVSAACVFISAACFFSL